MNTLTRKLSQVSLLLSAGLILAACGSGDSAGTDTNLVTLKITDAPVDEADDVWVEFTAVTFKSEEDEDHTFELDPAQRINLLALQGSDSQALLENVEIPAGNYNQIRLAVNAEFDDVMDSYITIDGTQHELRVPSGSESGLKLNTPFTIAEGTTGMTVANENSVYTIDFDLRKSIVNPVGQPGYFLKPVLRLVQNINTGTISGNVSDSLLVGTNCSDQNPLTGNAVYVFAGENITPDDIDGNEPDPITTAMVNFNDQSGLYSYEVGFISEGNYTLAMSCSADLDNIDTDDSTVLFDAVDNVSVVAGENTEHNIN
ncbi:MAG TPA: DUF4382 domain-containing protein [Gammaproteobacteria bacterium]